MPHPLRVGRAPLVGRALDLATVTERLDAARRSEGGIVLISGEPGIGKSRLVAEVASRARTDGWIVLRGHAYDMDGMPPYLPFVEAIAESLRMYPDIAVHDLGELGSLLPGAPATSTASDGAAPTEVERYRLFEGVWQFLLHVAHAAELEGVLLCLEDLQWADKSSLQLLHHLARRLDGSRLLVVATCRPVQAAAHPLNALLAELTRERLDRRLVLTPLAPNETSALVEALSEGPVSAAVAAEIYRLTEGNPFFVEEIVRHLTAGGRDLGSSRLATFDWGIPEGVREVIASRLARLTRVTVRLLQSAAIIGDVFDLDIAMSAAELLPAQVTLAVDEAIAAAMIREDATRYRFGHPLIQHVVNRTLNQPRRQELHLRVAAALQARAESRRASGDVAVLAAHYRQAGPLADSAAAIDCLRRASSAAERVFASDEAAAYLESALSLMDVAGVPASDRADASLHLAELLRDSGFDNYPRAIGAYARALELYEQAADTAGVGRAHLGLGRTYSMAAATMDLSKALEHLTQADAILASGPPGSHYSPAAGSLAQVATWQLRTADGLALAQLAHDFIEQHGVGSRFGPAILIGFNYVGLGQLAAGFEWLNRACAFADRINQTFDGFASAVWSGARCFWLGDPRGAQAYYERELARPRLQRAPLRRRALLGDLAVALALAGDPGEAERLVLEEVGDDVLDQSAETYAQPLVAFYRGDLATAEALWSAAVEHHERSGNRCSKAAFDLWLAKLNRLRGEAALAETRFRSVLEIGLAAPHLPYAVWAAAELALLCIEQQRAADGQALVDQCRAIVENGEDWRGLVGHVAVADAAVRARLGDHSAAEPRFEQAVAVFQRYSLPWDEAQALRLWAGALLIQTSRSQRARGVEKLDAALKLYRGLGAGKAWLDLVEREQAPVRPLLPDGLTHREAEVLRLVALGMSSREIGEQLVLSVRTVERHVANIYLKTRTHGRAQATAYALAKRLAST